MQNDIRYAVIFGGRAGAQIFVPIKPEQPRSMQRRIAVGIMAAGAAVDKDLSALCFGWSQLIQRLGGRQRRAAAGSQQQEPEQTFWRVRQSQTQ